MAQSGMGPSGERDQLGGLYGLSAELVRDVQTALAEDRTEAVVEAIGRLHAADQADLFEQLAPDERERMVSVAAGVLQLEFFAYLDETVREEMLEELDTGQIAAVIQGLDSDDAIDLIEDLEEDEQRELLAELPAAARALFEEGLAYPEDSAGRLMQREAAIVPSFWTVGRTIDHMRVAGDAMPKTFYDIFVLGPTYRPLGIVPVSRLLRATRDTEITALMQEDIKVIPAEMDQENVAFLFRQYGLVSAPVVDAHGRMVGVVTVDDVVEVIHEEHEEDILNLAGLKEDDFYDAVLYTTRARSSWLLVNVFTAFLAASVIGLFDGVIEKVVALAVLMPIVASMGGNAGLQTLTVAVRALAMKELTPSNAMRIVGKEVLVGGINGFVFAIVVGGVAWAWFGRLEIGLVIAGAMAINLIVAGFMGTIIPLALDRMRIDPAVGSSVILTTITDVVGFFVFLGLGSLILI